MHWTIAIGFVTRFVIPVVRDVIRIVGADAYSYIVDECKEAQRSDLDGLTKRARVYTNVMDRLEKEKGDVGPGGSVAVYFLIELAVMNLRRKS